MATGDLLSIVLQPDGWYADFVFSGFTAGATYAYGFGTNNDPITGSPKGVFSVTSPGFDRSGNVTTVTRNVYVTAANWRWPFGTNSCVGSYTSGTFLDGETLTASVSGSTAKCLGVHSAGTKIWMTQVVGTPATNDVWTGGTSSAVFSSSAAPVLVSTGSSPIWEFSDGTNLTCRLALSEFIYPGDTINSFTLLSGMVTNTGGASQSSTTVIGTITNNSTLAYPRVVGNTAMPCFDKVGNILTMRVVAAHRFAMNGQQVACVNFTASDTHGHTVTQLVQRASIDTTYGDYIPIIEYRADLDVSGFTQGDTITANYQVFPWIGDAQSVLDSAGTLSGTIAGTAQPATNYGPLTFIADSAGTYCNTIAVVDPANGNDGTGSVAGGSHTAFSLGSPPASYATIGAAYAALKTMNNSYYSRNNCGGSVIYLKDNNGVAQNHTYPSGPSAGTACTAWFTMQPYPGVPRENVPLAATAGYGALSLMCKLKNLLITTSSNVGLLNLMTYVWFDQCVISVVNSAEYLVYLYNILHFTRCTVTNYGSNISGGPGTQNAALGIVRGSFFSKCYSGGYQTVIGSRFIAASGFGGFTDTYINTAPQISGQFFGFNWLTNGGSSGTSYASAIARSETFGCAFIQNLIELAGTNQYPAGLFGADSSIGDNNNTIIHNNTFIGTRINNAYDEYGGTGQYRLNWSIKNNIFEIKYIKDDYFQAGTTGTISVTGSGPYYYTFTANSGHAYVAGDVVNLSGQLPVAYNGNFLVSSVTATSVTFVSPTSLGSYVSGGNFGQNPNRIKGWAVSHGVGHSGNWNNASATIAANAFAHMFTGLRCYQPPGAYSAGQYSLTGTPNSQTTHKYNAPAGYLYPSTAGSGNYHPTGPSPSITMAGLDWVLPYDLDGKPRTILSNIGAYGTFQSSRGPGTGLGCPKAPKARHGVAGASAAKGINRF
jgi:hypothetical protein